MWNIRDRMSMEGRVALVTGGARGQGAAHARLLVAADARVVISDVLEEEGRHVAGELGSSARFVRHDVTSEAEWSNAVKVAVDEFGCLDVLVNNAGIHRSASLLDESPDQFTRLWNVNLFGAFLGIQASVPALREAGGGTIVNIASTAGAGAIRGHAGYGSSKWGLRGLSAVAAVELGPFGIRVNTIIPGAINTAMMSPLTPETAGRFGSLPLGRCGEPDEVAWAVLYLASDASSYVTGAELFIDGGASIDRTRPT